MIDRLHLSERGITGLEIDSRNLIVRVKIDSISRLPVGSNEWSYYDEEDLDNGYLVFSDVFFLEVSPAGIIPGDYIIEYELVEKHTSWEFTIITVGQPNRVYKGDKESTIKIKFHDCWLENKNKERVP